MNVTSSIFTNELSRERIVLSCAVLFGVLALTGCGHRVRYYLNEEDFWRGQRIGKTVAVQSFNDTSTAQTQRVVKIEQFTWRTNARDGYRNKEIAQGVTTMVASHLHRSKLFTKAGVEGQIADADWQLSGTITEYSSMARANKGAEAAFYTMAVAGGFMGSLVGAAGTGLATTEVHASAELSDLTLKDTSTGEVLWQDSIRVSTNYVDHWSKGSTTAVYQHADECLKQAVAEMIRRLASKFLPQEQDQQNQ